MIHLLALVVAPIVVNCVTELFKEQQTKRLLWKSTGTTQPLKSFFDMFTYSQLDYNIKRKTCNILASLFFVSVN